MVILNDAIRVGSAADGSINPMRLMHGEDPLTESAGRAAYWAEAYRQLLAFKDQLLVDMETGIRKLSTPAQREIRELDVNLIELQRDRYRLRLSFWQDREEALEALGRERIS